jgi:hypothetical protein
MHGGKTGEQSQLQEICVRSTRMKTIAATTLILAMMLGMGLATVLANDEGDEGLTPGYWKSHPEAWSDTVVDEGTCPAYCPQDCFDDAFRCDDDGIEAGISLLDGDRPTLIKVLNSKGGGRHALGRHAVAALLNAAHPKIHYRLHRRHIIHRVRHALVYGTDEEIEDLKTELDCYNNLGCPDD